MLQKTTIIMMLLLIIACGTKTPDYPIKVADYRKGTDGLAFEFFKNGPPDRVFESQSEDKISEFEIAAQVWNKGAYDLEEGYITATLEQTYMCILAGSACAQFNSRNAVANLEAFKKERTNILAEINRLEAQPVENPSSDAARNSAIENQKILLTDAEQKIRAAQQELGTLNSDLSLTLDNLKGRGIQYPEGSFQYVTFRAQAKKLDLLTEQHTTPVILTACYGYTTMLSQDICIDPDPTGIREIDKPCQMINLELSDQGAPIAITGLEVNILPDGDYSRPQFLIKIKNKGDGTVVNRDKLVSACTSAKLVKDDWNMVTLSEFGLGNENYMYQFGNGENDIICERNPIKLVEGEGTIRCTVKKSNDLSADHEISRSSPAFVTQAFVRLDYGYTKSITKNVIVDKVR